MSDKYTPGLLAVNPLQANQICTADGSLEIAVTTVHYSIHTAVSNARRLAACWNACQGISTEELVDIANAGGMLGPREDIARVAGQRDELLKAVLDLREAERQESKERGGPWVFHRISRDTQNRLLDAHQALNAAIAKCRGEA